MGAQVGEAPERRRAEDALEVDRHGVADGRVGPPGLEELLAGGDEVVRPGADALGVAQDHRGAVAQGVEDALHAVDQCGRQRLHALNGDALRELGQQVDGAGQLVHQRGRAGAHRLGQQHLAARRGPQSVLGDLEAALVGHLEPADLLDRVAPELDPDRVVLGGREHVEDAAAHGELAAALDEVGAGVCRGRQVLDDPLEGGVVPGPQRDGREVAETCGHGLEHRPHRCHDHVERTVGGVGGVGVLEPAQHGQPLADRVTARAEALVGQGLPGREVGHPVTVEEAAERCDEVFGLTGRGRHGQDRPSTVARHRGDQGGPRAGGDREVGHRFTGTGDREGPTDGCVGAEEVEQRREGHERAPEDNTNAPQQLLVGCPPA